MELCRTENGSYPAILNTDLNDYLKSPFPSTIVGGATNAAVKALTINPFVAADADDAGGWLCHAITGELRINMTSYINY